MKSGTAVVAILFALASSPLLAQQTSPANQPNRPAAQQSPSDAEAAQQNSPAASAETSTIKMSPIDGELVSALDSKTAKTGDSVVVRTKTSAKTADGTEIPKGSKLVGRVINVQPSGAGENSQMALQFDHVELKGGQNLPVHSQIESIAPAASTSGAAATGGEATSAPAAGGSSNSGAMGGSTASRAPQGTSGGSGATAAGDGGPAAGTVVAKSGAIAIKTTSIPGVLLANNAPGQQDPRMATASSILLGAKQDIQLNGGTQMVVKVSAAGAGPQ